MSKLSFLVLSVLIYNNIHGQKPDGKWILKEAGYKEFKKNTGLQILDFRKLTKSELDLHLIDNTLFLENEKKYATVKLIEENFLRLFVDGTFNDEKVKIELDFVRLLPTKTKLSKNEIEALSFEFQEEGKSKSKIAFNKELMNKEMLQELKWKEGLKMVLEKLDNTYFITIFRHGRKGASLPISEVNQKVLKFYGVPTKSGEIIAWGIN